MTVDPKPLGGRRRIVDPSAVRRAALRRRECAACGEPGANGHHVLERDDGGDDVDENIVTLCGSGTRGCHGAIHGNPYVSVVARVGPGGSPFTETERRDRDWVARRIGLHLYERPETLRYVVERAGLIPACHYLLSRYSVPASVVESAALRRDTLPA